jgi:hypothetical protein
MDDPRTEDIRATAAQLALDADELGQVERAKSRGHPAVGRLRQLTERAEQLVRRITRLNRVQRQLIEETVEVSPDPNPAA